MSDPDVTSAGETGRLSPLAISAVALLALVVLLGVITVGRDRAEPERPASSPSSIACLPGPGRPAPTIDLGVQAATGDVLLRQAKVDRLVRLAERAGASVISTSTSWRYLQPTAAPEYDFAGIDRVVSSARAAGLQVRLQLIGMPEWAVSDQSRPWSRTRPPLTEVELQRWTAFVSAVAEHVKGEVDYLEIWNEPNGATYWPTGPDPRAFANLLTATYDPVKAVAPDLQVISGGLVGNDIGYLEHLYDAVGELGLTSSPFDLVGVHPFTGSAAPDTVDPARTYERDPFGLFDENFTGYRALHEVMEQHGDTDRDVYIGAFGYGTRTLDGNIAVPDDVRATYAVEALKDVTCSSFVRAFSWYYLHPTEFDPEAWTLLDDQLRPNQTYRAFVQWNKTVRVPADEAAGVAGSTTERPTDQ